MTDEYIPREATLKAIYTSTAPALEIEAIPAADVAPVRHGRFIGTEFNGYINGYPVYYEWICSECGCVFEDDEPKTNYCPNCGAKMDGGQDE